MIGELIPTGVTFGTGRISVNDQFSGTAEFNYVEVSGNLSAGTGGVIYSGGTDLYSIFSTGSDADYWTAGTGTNSIAQIGGGNISSGITSVAEGTGTIAGGDYSHSEGYAATALSIYSHAEGRFTKAIGAASHSEGYGTTASGAQSHAEGSLTIAEGDYSHSEGFLTTASGSSAHAEGSVTTAFGQASHAEGGNSTADGNFSHVEGSGSYSFGDYSHAEGYQTIAIGTQAHSEGYSTIASGNSSHSEGFLTTAIGTDSHAGGSGSISIGDQSFVHGLNSIASGASTIVFGNGITGTTANTVYVPYLNIQSLAAGTSVNNLGVDSGGNVVVGSASGGATINPYLNLGTTGLTAINWNVSGLSTNYEVILSGDVSLNLTSVRNGEYGTIIVTQDSAGGRNLTFGTVNGLAGAHKVVNGGGGAPTLTSTASATDILSFTYNGSTMYWTVGNDYT